VRDGLPEASDTTLDEMVERLREERAVGFVAGLPKASVAAPQFRTVIGSFHCQVQGADVAAAGAPKGGAAAFT
jgi:hypothetical protein